MKQYFLNPLLVKELREEMRSRKIFVLVPAFVGILSIVALVAVSSTAGTTFNPIALSSGARVTLYSFVVTITILLGLVSTVLGASSFTTEREKATYELLELTPLSYGEMVFGKFLYSAVLVGMVLVSSLPMLSVLFFMGGVTYGDLFLTLFYLMVFFGVAILGAIGISVVSRRTILSIILALAIAFLFSIFISILSAASLQTPQSVGFGIISPWLVTWQQIFSPVPLKLLGAELPVWPFYLTLYALLGLLFLVWARNALDNRKQERSIWARVLGLVILPGYIAVGLLCLRSYSPMSVKDLQDFYSVTMIALLGTTPFFAVGTMTERDRILFLRRPLVESFHPRKALLNYPPTGPFYLIVLLFLISVVVGLCGGLQMKLIWGYYATLLLWVFPWSIAFIGLRLLFSKAQAIFIIYGIGTLFYSIFAIFRSSGKRVESVFDFYIAIPDVFFFAAASVLFYALARAWSRKRNSQGRIAPAIAND